MLKAAKPGRIEVFLFLGALLACTATTILLKEKVGLDITLALSFAVMTSAALQSFGIYAIDSFQGVLAHAVSAFSLGYVGLEVGLILTQTT
jgi:hypothetical protein